MFTGCYVKIFVLTTTAITETSSFVFLNRTRMSPPSSLPSSLPSALHTEATTSDDNAVTTDDVTGPWSRFRQKAIKRCIIPLSPSSYKGSSGRIGVLGGSARYTGAPYYAAMASLKAGADLAYCFCAEEAAVPIKSYSPELMVVPVYKSSVFDDKAIDDEETERLVKKMVDEVCLAMDKMHVLVLGPGLGRCPFVLEATARIIQRAQSQFHLPLVIDADALFLLTLLKYQNLLTENSNVILTPNKIELQRLRESNNNLSTLPQRCLIVEKGAVDIIRPGNNNSSTSKILLCCNEVGGLKRSGGIGDILSGTMGALVAWNNIMSIREEATDDDLPLSCWTACCFVKQATKAAFDRYRRSTTAPDILSELGPSIDRMTSDE